MPNLQSQATLIRAGKYKFSGYLATVVRVVKMSRAVNGSVSYPCLEWEYNDPYSGTGSINAVREGMLVLLYDQNTTTLKGFLRVAAGVGDANTLQLNEFSRGWLDVVSGDRFDIVEEYRVWDSLVSATSNFLKDSRIEYTDQTDAYDPIANGGGVWFGMVDDGETYATVLHDWTTSVPVDPDNTGGLTYAFDNKDGTITVGSDTSSTCTVQYPAGFRTIELTVTDDNNGESSIIHVPIYVFDNDTYTPLAVQALERSMDVQSGVARLTFSLPRGSEGSITSLPDGAPIYYFETETRGTTVGSLGSNAPTERSHMKFAGFLVRDSITITPDGDEVTFEAVNVLGILEQTAALPQLMIRDETPSNWQEAKGLTVSIALWYIWKWGTTAGLFTDLIRDSGLEVDYSRITVEDTSSLLGQLRDIANSLNVQVTCDWLGRIHLVRDPNYLTIGGRGSVTNTYVLTTADVMEVGIDREHRRAVKFVRGEAITPGATQTEQTAVFANAPGDAPAEGTARETFSRKIATQTEINRDTGEHYARLNGTWYDEDTGAITLVPKGARIRLPDGYDIFDPAYREFVKFVLPATTNTRGIAFTTDTRWTIESMSVRYDAGTGGKDIELVIDHETHGVPGTTYEPPDEDDLDLPDLPDLPDFPGITPVPGGWVLPVAGSGRLCKIMSDGTFQRTSNFTALSPTWDTVTVITLALNEVVTGFAVDATNTENGWVITTLKIYYVSGIFDVAPSPALQHTLVNAVGTGKLHGIDADYLHGSDIGQFVVASYVATGQHCAVTASTDGGGTWSAPVQVGIDFGNLGFANTIRIAPGTAGRVFVKAGIAILTGHLFESTDYCASFTQRQYIDKVGAAGFLNPYASGVNRIFSGGDAVGSVYSVYRGDVGGVPTLIGSGGGTTAAQRKCSLSMASNNPNRLLVCTANSAGASLGLAYTDNAEAATPSWTMITAQGSSPYDECFLTDPDGAAAYLWGTLGAIGYWNGSAVSDKRGNRTSDTARVVMIAG